MGSFSIIQALIVFHDDAGFRHGKEDLLVKALVSKAAMETFNKNNQFPPLRPLTAQR